MGKKRQTIGYDKRALQKLALQIRSIRRPINNVGFPKVNPNLEKLEETLKLLPRKEREVLEKFWGLIPGTADLSKSLFRKSQKDIAYQNMIKATEKVIIKLLSIEYMYLYDENVSDIVANLNKKVNKEGVENVSEIDTIKYILIYIIFFMKGPSMLIGFGRKGKIDLEYESLGHFDEYALLKTFWECSACLLEDHSINLKLLMEMIHMFDLRDVISMKKSVGLSVSRAEDEIETERLFTFKEIRLFKERIFPYGAWNITCELIVPEAKEKNDLEEFSNYFSTFRENWENVEKFKNPKKLNQKLMTSKGERELVTYEIGGLTFTDIYEVMFLYVSRNLL